MSTTHSTDSELCKNEKDVSNESVKLESGVTSHDPVLERSAIRAIDWRLMPIFALVYSFSLIVRMNISSAYTAGMSADLQLSIDNRYSIINCMYLMPFLFLQLPGNLVLRRLGVRNMLAFVVFGEGICVLGMGFARSWGWLVLCRVLEGAFECVILSSMLFLMSTWYKRYEVHKRVAIFLQISITAGGLSPLFGYALNQMDGVGNYAGWRWIFIIEGLLMVVLSTTTYLLIPEFPDRNTFLTVEQTEAVLKRIDEDRGDAMPDEITYQKIKRHMGDWKIWCYGLIFLFYALPGYGQNFFLPIILKGMGWSTKAALLLSVLPFLPSLPICIILSHYSDKLKHRGSFIIGGTVVCSIGLALTAFAKENSVRYLGIFLMNAGNGSTVPAMIAYSMNNVVTHSKRSVVSAITLSCSSVGGVIASVTFRAADYPRYIPGLSVTMGCQLMVVVVVIPLTYHLYNQNKLSREGKLAEPLEGVPGFQYTL
ncbi:hypothetical protein CVT24_005378 [Panaeolus cyanescens]|uniref:Major facilitator superfamily (MFS) profile domain-containing protein n=1 Tax=Panaeolus cyanescens TaxID=181874 RepID=A0A409Y8F5_9AGAR|nr:hypothetical protein CVT24_005378 [Panaeolus cyanescens]